MYLDDANTTRTWTYNYGEGINGYDNPTGLLTSVETPESINSTPIKTQYTYYTDNARENLLRTVIDPNGGETTYEYYANRRGFQVTDAEGNTEHFSYNLYRNQTDYTNNNGITTRYSYDEHGRVIQELFANRTTIDTTWGDKLIDEVADQFGQTDSYSYDFYGNLTTYVNRENVTTTYTYDTSGYNGVTSITVAGNTITEHSYNSDGSLDTITEHPSAGVDYVMKYGYYGSTNGLPHTIVSVLVTRQPHPTQRLILTKCNTNITMQGKSPQRLHGFLQRRPQ